VAENSPASLRAEAARLSMMDQSQLNSNAIGMLQVAVRVFQLVADRWEQGKFTEETAMFEIDFVMNRLKRYMTAVVTEQRSSAVMGLTNLAQRLGVCHVWLLTGKNIGNEE
jgi:hypothetical protein